MKKTLLLLLAAGCLSCLSVNAQNRLNDPMSRRDAHHPKAKKTAVLPARQALTRAAAQALPDSTVWVEPEDDSLGWNDPSDGVKSYKEVYTYTEESLLLKQEGLVWNADRSEWVHYEDHSYTYTDKGLVASYKYTNADGIVYEQKVEFDGNKATYTAEESSPNYPTKEYKGDLTYNDQGLLVARTEYITTDINGDGKIDAGDYNTDGTPWYKNLEYTAEYDASGEYTKETEIGYWENEISYTDTWTYYMRGNNQAGNYGYRVDYVTEYPGEEAEKTTYQYTVWDGNPQKTICIYLDTDAGRWMNDSLFFTYFPKSGETANETVEAPAEGVKVAAADGKIFVFTPESKRVEVYSIVGKCCYNAVVNGNASVSGLPAGIYVVRADGKAMKVCVR